MALACGGGMQRAAHRATAARGARPRRLPAWPVICHVCSTRKQVSQHCMHHAHLGVGSQSKGGQQQRVPVGCCRQCQSLQAKIRRGVGMGTGAPRIAFCASDNLGSSHIGASMVHRGSSSSRRRRWRRGDQLAALISCVVQGRRCTLQLGTDLLACSEGGGEPIPAGEMKSPLSPRALTGEECERNHRAECLRWQTKSVKRDLLSTEQSSSSSARPARRSTE